jgi:Flp pilus assembly protein TadB
MSVESKSTADASIGELVSQLSTQASRLVRDEMKLATKELQQSARHAGIGAGLFSAAGLLGVLGLMTLIAAGVAALALVLPVWAAAVIVAVVIFIAAGVAALFGRKQAAEIAPPPMESVDSVKADIKEVKDARS